MSYANKDDGRPCEHVTFNLCLSNNHPSTHIVVQPQLHTEWDEPVELSSRLVSGGLIQGGLMNGDGLMTAANDPHKGTKLVNGPYSLRINADGLLVVERNDTVVWEADVYHHYFSNEWSYMFLILDSEGVLQLVQQVDTPPKRLRNQCLSVDDTSEKCRIIVWTSGVQASNSESGYFLELTRHGNLRVTDGKGKRVLWQTCHDGDGMNLISTKCQKEEKLSIADAQKKLIQEQKNENTALKATACIPSGNEESINKALKETNSEAVLCQGTIFKLYAPVRFTEDGQKLYTEGFPNDDRRARLIVTAPSVVSAIMMTDMSDIEVSNIVIDGNRPLLGYVLPMGHSGLIAAGGNSVGQVIREVKAYEPRSWTTVHFIEGDPSRSQCIGALVELNEFGPAGLPAMRANGISMACKQSIIQQNTITDVTDGGIVLYCSPGTVVKHNNIRAVKRTLLGGIKMVDYDPFQGNYRDTIVHGNVIEAKNSTIHVGLGMGVDLWSCGDNGAKKTLFGGTVTRNTLRGRKMQYGYAVSGVWDWQATGNVDDAAHVGFPRNGCHDQPMTTTPSGFQINRKKSAGMFQSDFEDAILDLAAHAIPDPPE